jgi:hypothetical protein
MDLDFENDLQMYAFPNPSNHNQHEDGYYQ